MKSTLEWFRLHELPSACKQTLKALTPQILGVVGIAVLGISWWQSTILVTVVSTLTWSSSHILHLAEVEVDNLGVSILTGIGLQAGASQLLLWLGVGPTSASYLPLLLVLAVGGFAARHRKKIVKTSPNAGFEEGLLAILVALVVLSLRHAWLLPFAAAVAAVTIICLRPPTWLNASWMHVALRLSLVASWILSSQLRPRNWYYFYQSNDIAFFESMSWSVTHFGVGEHPGLLGASFWNYHWLIYGFSGFLSRVADLEPFHALAAFGPAFLLFALSAALLGLGKSSWGSDLSQKLLIGVACVSAIPTFRNDSFAFSLFAAVVFVSITRGVRRYRCSTALVLSFLSILLVYAKVTTAVVVLLLLIANSVFEVIAGHARQSWIPVITLGIVLLVLYLVVFRTQSAGDNLLEVKPQFDNSLREVHDFFESSGNVAVMALLLLTIRIPRADRNSTEFKFLPFLLITFSLLIASWVQAAKESPYLGLPALYVLVFLAVAQFPPQLERSRRLRSEQIVLLSLAIALAFGARPVLRRVNDLTNVESWMGTEVWNIVVKSGLMIMALVLTLVLVSLKMASRGTVASSVILVLLGLLAGNSLDGFRRQVAIGASTYEEWPFNTSPFPTQQLEAMGNWIRENTESSEILASNNFMYRGDGWWLRMMKDPQQELSDLNEASWGGANYHLPATSQRRFLVQGPRFLTGYEVPTSDLAQRMNATLAFANRPSLDTLNKLRAYGVSGYVVNLDLALADDWSAFANERFRSGSYLYLDLGE
ncbi:MAG: hypothetical protein EBT80_08675 [Chitinophagales bacterium]|nr:hypothetical protein [Chitinophagales bacterium]